MFIFFNNAGWCVSYLKFFLLQKLKYCAFSPYHKIHSNDWKDCVVNHTFWSSLQMLRCWTCPESGATDIYIKKQLPRLCPHPVLTHIHLWPELVQPLQHGHHQLLTSEWFVYQMVGRQLLLPLHFSQTHARYESLKWPHKFLIYLRKSWKPEYQEILHHQVQHMCQAGCTSELYQQRGSQKIVCQFHTWACLAKGWTLQ